MNEASSVAAASTPKRHRYVIRRSLLLCVLVVVAAACASTTNAPQHTDIVSQIPWSAPETHTYELQENNKPKATTTLSIARDGDAFVLTQRTADDAGNSDESVSRVDASTLKPLSNVHSVTDPGQKRVADATYEDVAQDCSSKRVVRITQLTYKPPDAADPESTRSNPLCVPDHAYDNDTSLFIWRTLKFEKGYTVTYSAVFSNRRDTQDVTLSVGDKETVTTPAGNIEAWIVDLTADEVTQRAWVATSPDHKLVAYQNESFFFRLKE
jgi:Protein of unknown function (DUF3108)